MPRPVWVDPSGMWSWKVGRPSVGILVEWRPAVNRRGQNSWEALVMWAHGGGEVHWSTGCTWMRAECVRPMSVIDWKDPTVLVDWTP